MGAALITVFTNTLLPVQLLRKYRPPVAMLVVTTSHSVAQQANAIYSCVPFLLSDKEGSLEQAKKQAVEFAKLQGLAEFCEVRPSTCCYFGAPVTCVCSSWAEGAASMCPDPCCTVLCTDCCTAVCVYFIRARHAGRSTCTLHRSLSHASRWRYRATRLGTSCWW